MLEGKELEAEIASRPGDKVTREDIEARIADTHYFVPPQLPGTMTLCIIELDNGFTVAGKSACADPTNFSVDIGMALSYADAFKQLWPLFGFLLTEQRYLHKMLAAAKDVAAQADEQEKAVAAGVTQVENFLHSNQKSE